MNLDQQSVKKIMQLMNKEDKKVPTAVEKAFPQIEVVINKVIETIRNGGKIVYMGAGTSGRLGVLDASECPPTFGVSPDLFTAIIAGGDQAIRNAVENAEDDEAAGAKDVQQTMATKDFLVAIAASGETPYVIGGIKQAKKMHLSSACIVCKPDSTISKLVDFPIDLFVGKELVRGSTRLKAGTAQKLVLNMISTISMVKLGKVYDDYMVDVQATNKKLRKRIVSIAQEITQAEETEVKKALDACHYNLKAAILVIKYQIQPKHAEEVLSLNNHDLRKAINSFQDKRHGGR